MANLNKQIEDLRAIIADKSGAAAAYWMAVQQADTVDAKNAAGYHLFVLTVGLLNFQLATLLTAPEEGLDDPTQRTHEISERHT